MNRQLFYEMYKKALGVGAHTQTVESTQRHFSNNYTQTLDFNAPDNAFIWRMQAYTSHWYNDRKFGYWTKKFCLHY